MRTHAHRAPAGIGPALIGLWLTTLCGCNALSGYANNESGRSYYQQGNYAMAQMEFQRAANDHPGNADYVHNLATTLKKQGDLAGAEQMYRRALQVDPSHQPSYHQLASLLIEQGRQFEAVNLMDVWTGTQPYSPEAHIETAWLRRQMGDVAGAEQSLEQVLRLRPNHPIALAHLGEVRQLNGQSQQAADLYRRSLLNDWSQPEVRQRLASLKESTQPAWTPRIAQTSGQGFGSPMFAGGFGGMPSFFQPTPPVMAYQQPIAPVQQDIVYTAAQPIQPIVVNADPAHVTTGVASSLPVVRPF